ncbi:hypothetical protein PS9374_05165 [Planomonospora sphaerica]|uniref:Uncharacterized protein n=2 Tax=Planomonospora sphaerica TaxID=161355 RepID=A0A171DKZ6_9ACTN|nr:hypothetical protein PS9374_05165 [Planomonospora sphaerica]
MLPGALPVEAFAASNTVILAVANELTAGTIETVLAKSDLKLGVEALAGAPARQANPFADASPVRVRHPLAADDTDETPWLTDRGCASASAEEFKRGLQLPQPDNPHITVEVTLSADSVAVRPQ